MRYLAFSPHLPIDDNLAIHPSTSMIQPSTEQGAHLDNLVGRIAESQEDSIQHEAIGVSLSACPLRGDVDHEVFVNVLSHLHQTEYLPPNLLVQDEEWNGAGYPVSEVIPGGLRGKKALRLDLPASIWLPRAILWTQALTTLEQVVAHASL